MRRLVEMLLGVPVTEGRLRAEAEIFVRARDVHSVRAMLNEQIAHMTGKSGALLQAQGIFVVVATYALDKGWPAWVALSSMLLLIVAALALMTNLRTVFIGIDPDESVSERAEFENVVRTAALTGRRGVVFNLALYLTFLSVLLLGIGAVILEFSGRSG
ncbi:MAG TPA: hypothetical protein VL286_00415 [Rhizomicrobium sp.]|jgi:hypothetical protein|nr:hypothetical protein [Rhizomicrobium sp.]